jgi:hypothetical protein
MRRRTRWILTAVAAGVVAAGVGGGVAVAGGATESDQPITGAARAKAEQAALAHTGGGRVTDTEVGDEDSYYEVEVTMPDGRQVDVQLDQSFAVVGANPDEETPNDGTDG